MSRFGTHRREPKAAEKNLGVLSYIIDVKILGLYEVT